MVEIIQDIVEVEDGVSVDHNQDIVLLDGQRVGYAARSIGSDVAIIEHGISDSQYGDICRALDVRDGCECPNRMLNALGKHVKASDVNS